MKISKRLISITLSLMLIITTFTCLGITYAGAKTGDVIYFEKPENWGESLYIHYWDAPSNNTSWPGDAMTKISDNLYSYTCPAGFTKFVINDNGSFQTADLKHSGDGYIWKVGTTSITNEYGNRCWSATSSKYSVGLSVSADPGSCEFLTTINVNLYCTNATSATYSINGGAPVEFTDKSVITLGNEAVNVGDTISLYLSATDGTETKTASYVYTKTDSPVGSSIVYFDNSKYNWEEVYLYAYGTKETAKWPGEKMQVDKNGLYYYTFSSAYSNENIIVNNGKEEEEKEQYPENGGLNITKGQCKLLTADNEWVDYGTPDGQPAGFAYTASNTAFDTDVLNVKIGLKNAVKGTYQLDGGTVFPYTEDTTVAVGKGVIGNKDITLTLSATSESGATTLQTFTYRKTFEKTNTSFASDSDGHTTPAIGGKYGTNPDMQLGKSKTITIDGNPSDWDSSMIVAQGVANDDPRVYMPSAMHEQPWDDYALYAAWDDDNLYFMWEMTNTTYVVSPSDNFAASKEARPWRNSIPMYLALSIDPEKSASGKATGTDAKTGATFTNPFVWGCDGGVAKDGGINFTTNVDTLIAFDSNNSNGGDSIFKADVQDENGDWLFNYDTAVPIGVTSYEKQDNQNGFKIAFDYGSLSESVYGVKQPKGSNKIGETFKSSSNWVDFKDYGYKDDHSVIYEVAVPFSALGIDKDYVENNGIGVMQILTYGTSGMDCLPYDPTMQDNANVEYSYDPSTSHEKEDVDNITVPLARVGALLEDTVITQAPFEVNFGADKSATQGIGTDIVLKAEGYNGSGDYSYEFLVDGNSVQSGSSDTYNWKPLEKKTYEISVVVKDNVLDKTTTAKTEYTIGDEPIVIETTPPPTAPIITPTNPTSPTEPSATEPSEVKKTTVSVPASKTVYVKKTYTIKPVVKNGKGATTYKTSDSKVATVGKTSGKVTAKKAGKATITVTNNGVKAKITITVKKPTVKANKSTLKVKAKTKITVKHAVGKIKFKALNNKVKVSAKGKVTALRKGKGKVQVTASGLKFIIKIKVK
ncbi:MAG: starch-binding protein [Ruminococcus sp.]